MLRALRPKLHRNPRLLGRRIFENRIFVSARQNRSQSFRIDEDFNKAEAEILPRKSYSDACAMVIRIVANFLSFGKWAGEFVAAN